MPVPGDNAGLFPILQLHGGSGLLFPWAEYMPGSTSSFEMVMGPDGVTVGMQIIINWNDLAVAVQSILGYSWYDQMNTRLSRFLPWQHPYNNQLWAKSIASVKGIRQEGYIEQPAVFGGSGLPVFGGGVGDGFKVNTGPSSVYNRAILTIHFWRPPYYIRTDADITDENGADTQEWLRYVDKNWELNTQMLSRENSVYVFSPNQGSQLQNKYFQGSVGQKLCHLKIKRTWYQLPEITLFETLVDQTPQGIPRNLLYTQTETTNPITGYKYLPGQPIPGCVNSPKGGGTDDSDPAKRFFGFPIGTLLFEGVEFVPRPLQMPASLMQINIFNGSEPISQVQYDVVFHFDYFDPPADRAIEREVVAVKVIDGGAFYSVDQTVITIAGPDLPDGTTATAIPIILDPSGSGFGIITEIQITNGGSGYTTQPIVTVRDPGGGTGAVLSRGILTALLPDNWRGHNLMPWSGNGLFYAVQSQEGPTTTPFHYADFYDLFNILTPV